MPYTVNGREVQLSSEPIEKNGRHYVPLKELVENLGGAVEWDHESKTARSTIGQWTATFRDESQDVDVNGQNVKLSAPPYLEGDRIYVPWDFFNDVYGYKADMNAGRLSISLM
jgi:hypothetical protein